jgi:hypothetical protein
MAPTSRTDREKLLRDLARAQELIEQGKFGEARELFERTRVAAQKVGITSGHLAWGMAIAADYEGDLEAAMQHILEALELDLPAGPFNRSLDEAAARQQGGRAGRRSVEVSRSFSVVG